MPRSRPLLSVRVYAVPVCFLRTELKKDAESNVPVRKKTRSFFGDIFFIFFYFLFFFTTICAKSLPKVVDEILI